MTKVLLLFVAGACAAAGEPLDVTAKVELLGSPNAAKYASGGDIYARNVWDLQVYQGRLYIGAGNCANDGPAVNAGPAPIYAYDPVSGKFQLEFTVDDEQVDIFYAFEDGLLYTPGQDPKESLFPDLYKRDAKGNWVDYKGEFYRREQDGQWRKYRNLPAASHTTAMALFHGELFAATLSTAWVSKDHGLNWADATAGTNTPNRIEDFLEAGGHLYGTGYGPRGDGHGHFVSEWTRAHASAMSQYDGHGKFLPRTDLTTAVMFPDTDLLPMAPGSTVGIYETGRYATPVVKMMRPVWMQGKAAYIGAYDGHNVPQPRPFGLYAASSLEPGSVKVDRVKLPDLCRPWDQIVRDGTAYVLLDCPEEQGTSVRVLQSKDLKTWGEVFRFHAATFARSFELLNGDFYFGLGTDIFDDRKWSQDELRSEAGNILRVRVKVN